MDALDKIENEVIATHSICIETFYLIFTSLFGKWAKIKAYLFFKAHCNCRNWCVFAVC